MHPIRSFSLLNHQIWFIECKQTHDERACRECQWFDMECEGCGVPLRVALKVPRSHCCSTQLISILFGTNRTRNLMNTKSIRKNFMRKHLPFIVAHVSHLH